MVKKRVRTFFFVCELNRYIITFHQIQKQLCLNHCISILCCPQVGRQSIFRLLDTLMHWICPWGCSFAWKLSSLFACWRSCLCAQFCLFGFGVCVRCRRCTFVSRNCILFACCYIQIFFLMEIEFNHECKNASQLQI